MSETLPRRGIGGGTGVDPARPVAIRHERPMREKTQLNLELSPKINSLQELAKEENECTRCPLYKDATQAVSGVGHKSAHVTLLRRHPARHKGTCREPVV